jgi:hypothetical protein
MGKFMWGVFTDYMGLSGSDIIAMTTANFSADTDPENEKSVYKGFSSYTRCVWEVRLGNAVSEEFILHANSLGASRTHPR